MKTLFIALLLVLSIPALAACQATARGDDGYVSVGKNDGYYRGNNDDGYFCPPGQAKKGRC